MGEFNSAQRVASLHHKLRGMVEGFDALLTELMREPGMGKVYDELVLQYRQGGGVRLRIEAERVDQATVDAAVARAGGPPA